MSGIYGQPSQAHQVQKTEQGGIGFLGLLTIVFIVLKLTGVIAWSWWWVLSPLWIPFGLGVGILLLGLLFLGLAGVLGARR